MQKMFTNLLEILECMYFLASHEMKVISSNLLFPTY